MKKLVLILITIMISANAFAVDEWTKGQLAGTTNASDIDAYNQANNNAQDRLLIGYKKGFGLNYATASSITILPGEIAIPNSGESIVRYRRSTSNITLNWSDIDTGAEANSTQYYIYLTADTDATTPVEKISASSSAPSSTTYYIKIGEFYNDSSGNITNVVSYRGDNGTDHADVIKGWLNYDGTTNTINDSYNVSSVTDNGTGDYTVNWDTAFANANYVVVGNCGAASDDEVMVIDNATPLTTSSFRFGCQNSGNGTRQDDEFVYVMAIGDRS